MRIEYIILSQWKEFVATYAGAGRGGLSQNNTQGNYEMNNPDTPDHPDTDPFEFKFEWMGVNLDVEAQVSVGAMEIIGCKIDGQEFDFERVAFRKHRHIEHSYLDSEIKNAAFEYLEAAG